MTTAPPDFTSVTEIAGDDVTAEQVDRLRHRYLWAMQFCADKDVLEVACGTGQGLGLLASKARSIRACDISEALVARARAHYGERVAIDVMDAEALQYADASLDVVIMFEALYYVPHPERFIAECRRVLRPGGVVILTNSNKDMADFNPSSYAHDYHGVVELGDLFVAAGFKPSFSGYWSYQRASSWQRALLPLKKAAVGLGLMPKTMDGKKFLKRMVFGKLVPMPAELAPDTQPYEPPVAIPANVADRKYRVIYCAAVKH